MQIVSVEYGTSKNNNPQFIFSLKDSETGYIDKFYCIDVEGKRGNLKMVLDACDISSDAEGNYSWDDPDVVGNSIICEVVHEPNDWLNRNGEMVHDTQHRIVEIKSLEWEENV